MKLQSKLGGLVSVKTKLFMGFQSVRGCGAVAWRPQADSWAGCVFTVLDLHKVDVPLFWKELARVADLGS
eukprot:925247-Pelagomonas_calceolata.AAC.1